MKISSAGIAKHATGIQSAILQPVGAGPNVSWLESSGVDGGGAEAAGRGRSSGRTSSVGAVETSTGMVPRRPGSSTPDRSICSSAARS